MTRKKFCENIFEARLKLLFVFLCGDHNHEFGPLDLTGVFHVFAILPHPLFGRNPLWNAFLTRDFH